MKINDKEQFLYLYNKGLNDIVIADYFKCSTSLICLYRIKLSLKANFHPRLILKQDFKYSNRYREERKTKYCKAHKEEIKEYLKEYRQAHKEELKEYWKEYWKAHKKEIKMVIE